MLNQSVIKKFFLLSVIVSLCSIVEAQNTKIDSLKKLLENEKLDTNRVILLNQLSYQYENSRPDTALLLAQRGLALARKNTYISGEVSCLNMIGLIFMTTGNYPKALEYMLQSLKGSEAANDEPSIATALENIGVIYSGQRDQRQGINYQLQALPINKRLHQSRNEAISLLNLGDDYEKLGILDSATYYTRKCYDLSLEIKADDLIGIALNNFGNIYSKMDEDTLALKYYHSDFPYLSKAADDDDFCETYLGMAKLFQKSGERDSCLYYAKLSLQIAKNAGFTDEVMSACNFLTNYYTSMRNVDSAFVYQSAAIVAKDSLFSQEKTREIQALKFDEAVRQQQLEEAKEEAHTQLKQNALFGGIFTLMIVAFILYRNNLHKQKANKILADQKQKVEVTLAELKNTQAQLIQSEKMASLGELTAGIAHEIQNPLNFVNNFSDINTDLIEELKDERQKAEGERNTDLEDEILNNIKANEEKINHHGKRADSIVKGMLQHSRSSTGVKEPTDINALCDEYLRLAYHGLRAKDKNFSTTIKTDFDNTIGKINIIPQDIGRVLLNLYNNAFYAVGERFKAEGAGYQPTVTVYTKKSGNQVRISVSDNGNGIPKNTVDKIFQPFFTTKPTGQGTGLGLSLSYDIINAHGGKIKVETKEGVGTEFHITVPA